MPTSALSLDAGKRINETACLNALIETARLNETTRDVIVTRAAQLVEEIRSSAKPALMEVFLAEYGLSTEEGVALMCLAEALLRVPDAPTVDALIEDKIAGATWSEHLGQSSSPLVNASTWGLLITGRVLDDMDKGIATTLRSMIRRLGEPVIRTAVTTAIKQMGRQFVLGESIESAMKRARKMEAQGYTYSYDMLGEAAMTRADAERYATSYADAIAAIAQHCTQDDVRSNPGISVKLSALHPRYEVSHTQAVMEELVPVVRDLARSAAQAGMGFNIDAEEADRLTLSLDIIEAVLSDKTLAGWDGFGVVVQAYGRRGSLVIDRLLDMAKTYDRKIMIRLVKGAYWDTEIKHAQEQGLADFPVFTRKAATDVSYLALARKLLDNTDRFYPQFATHNAHSVAAILEMAQDMPYEKFEFQRLHGMGEALHDIVLQSEKTNCRIYAPVGAHQDLLAYLVRRLLENGANSSFVNQIVDKEVPARVVAACPFAALSEQAPKITKAPDLFAPERPNSKGFDLTDLTDLNLIEECRILPADAFNARSLAVATLQGKALEPIINPTTGEEIGEAQQASAEDAQNALNHAAPWTISAEQRGAVLAKAADLYEENFGEAFALLAIEAGKTLPDAVAELREAVDFLRYYGANAAQLPDPARGIFTCISPWNFPLAIFTGQIAAALAAGNGVLAKPAETTPAIAAWAVRLLHRAGVPIESLQLLLGTGAELGTLLTSNPKVNGVAFTGSTATARKIQGAMAKGCTPGTPLIAETGGLNAMIVDSTALPEQAIRDIVASSFQSAGQRCSALRCLYVQEDIAEAFITQLKGAMDCLNLGDPWDLSTDVGPVITKDAADKIEAYVSKAAQEGRLVHRLSKPNHGTFVAPALLTVGSITEMEEEIFGPVLHVATFKPANLNAVIDDINNTGYGLTFGLHTRIERRVEEISGKIEAGNVYVNRNQIGAIVGSQPFGGEGLSGTGPKAGGPNYLTRYTVKSAQKSDAVWQELCNIEALQTNVIAQETGQPVARTVLPGPTGELNRLTTKAREAILCAGPGKESAAEQHRIITGLGGRAISTDGTLDPQALTSLEGFGGVIWWGDAQQGAAYAEALATREGPIVPLITDAPDRGHATHEQHLCVDTTAAGGNVSLLDMAS